MIAQASGSGNLFPDAPIEEIVVYIDCGARGNPGPAGFGVRVERADGTLTSFTGYGKGATYTVTSRSLLPTAAALRATTSA